jgi:hypothetical protein
MKKLIAGFMTALMALLPLVSAAQLGNYPAFLEDEDGVLDALVVVGSDAAPSDVVGAVDIAVRLAETGKTVVTQTCSGAATAVEGTRKDNVGLADQLSTPFPGSAVLKTAHYSGLKDSKLSWRGTDYDYREQVSIAGVKMGHDLDVSYVNGTETMIVESADVIYQFVFEKAIAGTGSIADPNYTYPINIALLGQSFAIVGTGSNSVKMLHGSIGTATATSGVTYGDYTVYSDLGSNAGWARVIIKDADDNTVDTQTINQGDSKQSDATGLTVQITAVRALMDGTIVGSDVVVGPTTEGVTKTYDVTADVTSTGTASDRFPGETEWGIEVASGTFATAGSIAVNDMIEVIYKPSSTQYLKAGEMLSLPNDYGNLVFEDWNTDQFATITVSALGGTISAYREDQDSMSYGNLGGIEISSDVAGSIVGTSNNGYDKAYILFNHTLTNVSHMPVMIGFYDSSKQKILVSPTFGDVNTDYGWSNETGSKIIDMANLTDTLEYDFKLCYGNACDQAFELSVNVSGPRIISQMALQKQQSASNYTTFWEFQNKTAPSTSQPPSFRLGSSSATAEVTEVYATTEGSVRNAGKKTQEIVTDDGVLLPGTETYGSSDKAVFKIPFKDLKAIVYFGKSGSGTVTGSEVSYDSYPSIPITSAIARLDTELTTADKGKNMISVGGSAVNRVSAEAMGLDYPTYGADSGIPEDKGKIMVVDSPYSDDKYVVVVVGWEADNTRTASSVLQLFDTKLDGITASEVEVSGTVGAPTVTELA